MEPERLSAEFGLFLDVDGTLIDIAPRPDDVVVPSSLVQDLAKAEGVLGGALALVSGRTIADLDRLFQPLRLKASGVHGAEYRFADGDGPAMNAEPLPERAWQDLRGRLTDFPGTLAENKGFSFAVHYRSTPGSGPRLREKLVDFVESHPGLGVGIMPGHYVFELKRPEIHKGAAIDRMLDRAPFRGRRPVFVGDDVTDSPGFAAVRTRGGLAYSVGEAMPGVTGTFPDPAAVRNWIAALARSEALTV